MATPAHSLEIWPRIVAGAVAQVTSWQDHANCSGADQDLFFPQRGASTRKAKAMCEACEVKAECLEFAKTQGERIIGIWGGLSERERRKIREQRTRAAKVT